jgi:hypothetical protein
MKLSRRTMHLGGLLALAISSAAALAQTNPYIAANLGGVADWMRGQNRLAGLVIEELHVECHRADLGHLALLPALAEVIGPDVRCGTTYPSYSDDAWAMIEVACIDVWNLHDIERA